MSHTNLAGESHRIYWQQWSANASERRSRRKLITSSAAIRISHSGAKARDVTNLIRQTLKLGDLRNDQSDSLVLVGTLYSLAGDHVQFEHAATTHHSNETRNATVTSGGSHVSASPPKKTSHRPTDPFHCVKTLHPDDDPIAVRKKMQDHLQTCYLSSSSSSASRTIIAPKFQWHFVPTPQETKTNIPNCVELDGYSTSMEDDDLYDDEEDTSTDSGAAIAPSPLQDILQKFPWLNDSNTNDESPIRKESTKPENRKFTDDERVAHEDRLFLQLSKSQLGLNKNHCLSGFLLKRSRRDPHVWRKVHCVLTDDYFWFVSRIYSTSDKRRQYARHGRVRLTQALLLEPSPDYVPLYRTPFSFEIVSDKGVSHWFRATSKPLQTKWIEALSDRIVQSFENSLLDQADMILTKESQASSRRIHEGIVAPMSTATTDSYFVGAVLRWGLQVGAFQECCRYIHSNLPAKSPVVAVSGSSSRSKGRSSVSVDPVVQAMIHNTWTKASELLAQATHLALQMHGNKLPRRLETQCQHIEYVILGHFKQQSAGVVDPVPIDLFDSVLTELRDLSIATTDTKEHTASENVEVKM